MGYEMLLGDKLRSMRISRKIRRVICVLMAAWLCCGKATAWDDCNLSDTFEWGWNQGPDYGGDVSPIGSCPLMNAVSLAGYARRRHEENWASASGKESYRRWNAQLVRLESESVTTNGTVVVAAQTLVSFDDTGLEGSASSVGSVAVSHPRGNATRERVMKAAGSEMLTETWYDANGQRTRVKDAGNNQASFSYADNFGPNTLPSGTNGFLRTLTYPVAKVGEAALTESWKVDPYLGMPVEAAASTEAYVTNAEYAAHGALAKWQLGNGLWEVAQFNDRLQMERKRIGLTNAAQNCGVAADDELCLEWGYGSASANNGNVMEAKQWSKKTPGGYLNLQSTFTYDGRNRLHTFNESVLSGGTSGGAEHAKDEEQEP